MTILNRYRTASQLVPFLLMPLLLAGCGVWQGVSDHTVDAYNTLFHNRGKTLSVDITAAEKLNPDDQGRPRAVAVRVYQLKDRKPFEVASYTDLIGQDERVIAPDVQARMATVVNPGVSASLSQPIERATKFIAIAAFYQPTGPAETQAGSWKQIIAVNKLPDDAPLKLALAERAIDRPEDNTRSGKR